MLRMPQSAAAIAHACAADRSAARHPLVSTAMTTTNRAAVVAVAMLGAAFAAACSKDPPAAQQQQQQRKHEDRHDPVVAGAPALALAAVVDGTATTWQRDSFDRVARFTGNTKAHDGEDRDVWSLRDLARTLVGPGARVTSVVSTDGATAIDRAAWDDASRTPVLHTTRRGTLKFRWTDAAGKWLDTEVRDVTRIEIAR